MGFQSVGRQQLLRQQLTSRWPLLLAVLLGGLLLLSLLPGGTRPDAALEGAGDDPLDVAEEGLPADEGLTPLPAEGQGQPTCEKLTARACMLQAITLLQSRGLITEELNMFVKDRLVLEEYLESEAFQARRARLAKGRGRGIAISAAHAAQALHAYINIKLIREVHGSSMPVEVVFNGKQEYDPTLMPVIAKMPNVRLVDASWVSTPSHHGDNVDQRDAIRRGWFFKAWIVYAATSFREVLYMDADNALLVKPEEVFDTPQYQQHGNLFWPDYTAGGEPGMWPYPSIYIKLGLPVPWNDPESNHFRTVESGQFLLDRARHADVLEWLWYINRNSRLIDTEIMGDKDTFEMAFMLANKTRQYQQVRLAAGEALGRDPTNDTRFVHRGMTQHLPDGRLAFHHRTAQGKFLPYCLVEDMAHSPCRVSLISAPLTPQMAVDATSRQWYWPVENLDLNAWYNLNCAYAGPGSDAPGEEYWPGIRCQGPIGDKLPVLPLRRLGAAGQGIDTVFQLYLQMHNVTAGAGGKW